MRPLASMVEADAPIQYGILQPGPDTPGGVPYVRPSEIQNDKIAIGSLRRATRAIADQYARSSLLPGDVLLSIVGSIGKVAVVPAGLTGANITQSSARLRPRAGVVDSQYLAWLLRSPHARAVFAAAELGTGVHRLNIGDIRKMLMPVAPLCEQRRIARKVQALVAQVDAARERLVRVREILKGFRQSVLAAAASGRLTEDWRAAVADQGAPAIQILQHLRALHKPFGTGKKGNAAQPSEDAHDLDAGDIPATWAIAELMWLCDPERPITYGILKPGPHHADGVPYVRVADFPDDQLRPSEIRRTTRTIADAYRRSVLHTGDVLLSIRGSYGRLCRVPSELDGANITQDTARLAIHELVNPDYVVMLLKAPATQDRMRRAARGVAVRGLNIGDVRALQLGLPPRNEANEIVRRVQTLFAVADKIELNAFRALKRSERLPHSILSRAFRGQLTRSQAELPRQATGGSPIVVPLP